MQQMLLTWCSTASIIHDADAADIDGVGMQMMMRMLVVLMMRGVLNQISTADE